MDYPRNLFDEDPAARSTTSVRFCAGGMSLVAR
jgi:hypothetical protein